MPTVDYSESYTNPERLDRLFEWMHDVVKHTSDVLPNGETYNTLMLLTVLSSMRLNIDKLALRC